MFLDLGFGHLGEQLGRLIYCLLYVETHSVANPSKDVAHHALPVKVDHVIRKTWEVLAMLSCLEIAEQDPQSKKSKFVDVPANQTVGR